MMVCLLLAGLIAAPSFAAKEKLTLTETFQTKAGEVEGWSNDQLGYEIRFKGKKLFKYDGPRLGGLPNVPFHKTFKNIDVLIVNSYAGDGCPNEYKLLAIWPNGKTYAASFGNCSELDESKIKIAKDKMTFDFPSHAFRDEPDNAKVYTFDGRKLR